MTKRDKLVQRIRMRPPTASFRDVRSLLEMYGWTLARTKGSHHSFTGPAGSLIVVPVHDKQVKRVYLDRICRELGLDEEYED